MSLKPLSVTPVSQSPYITAITCSLLCFEESFIAFIAVFFVLKALWGSVETVIPVNLILFFEVL